MDASMQEGELHRVLDAAERFSARPPDSDMQALAERSRQQPLFV